MPASPQTAAAPAQPPPFEHLLKKVFGYDTFLPLQREVITSVLKRQDTLAIMPTGGGKSLCYQIPALVFPGLTVVVSPLIALMQDQVAQLNGVGVEAVVLNSSLDWGSYRDNMDRVRQGKVKLLYVAPETLLTDRLTALLDSVKLDLLTIDEAHCISEWGHDFRPEYRQLVGVRKRYPEAACLALTATATARVQKDVQQVLGFKNSQPFVASFNRANLFLEVQPKKDAQAQTVRFLRRFPDQSGIIYCFSRQQVDDLAQALARQGFSVRPYHAGMSDADRWKNQDAFIRDDVQIIVATIAFGMGINKPNVRFIVHYDLPRNIESYYQEIGRAGRDGLPAHCLLLYSWGDTKKIEFFIQEKEEPERTNAKQHLQALVTYAESYTCRRIPLLKYFGEAYSQANCQACDNCQEGSVAKADLTGPAHQFFEVMRRTGERFGAMHLIDILLGNQTEKVLKFDHQRLAAFASGKDLDQNAWLTLSRQLEQMGLVERTDHQGLRLSAEGNKALLQRKAILGAELGTGRARAGDRAAGSRKPAQTPAKSGIPLLDYDVVLFDLLRKKRKELADHEKVPAYVVLPDRSLVEMSTYYPMSLQSLEKIHGFGKAKLDHYGKIFIAVIQDYARRRA